MKHHEGVPPNPVIASYLESLRQRLPTFVIYDHPTDWPDFFVARLWISTPEPQATELTIMDRKVERIRATLETLGLTRLPRQPEDDPKILETWI